MENIYESRRISTVHRSIYEVYGSARFLATPYSRGLGIGMKRPPEDYRVEDRLELFA